MPNWNRGELRQELINHGHHYLEAEPGRANSFIQRGLEMLISEMSWPFRERQTAPFMPPMTIADVGIIQQAWRLRDGVSLTPARRDMIQDRYRGVTQAGSPTWYFMTGQNTFNTFPASANDEVVVYYLSKYGWLTDILGGSGDTLGPEAQSDDNFPVVPSEYRDLIVAGARIAAKRDTDDFDQAQAIKEGEYDVRLLEMQEDLMVRQEDETKFIRTRDHLGWGGRWGS